MLFKGKKSKVCYHILFFTSTYHNCKETVILNNRLLNGNGIAI